MLLFLLVPLAPIVLYLLFRKDRQSSYERLISMAANDGLNEARAASGDPVTVVSPYDDSKQLTIVPLGVLNYRIWRRKVSRFLDEIGLFQHLCVDVPERIEDEDKYRFKTVEAVKIIKATLNLPVLEDLMLGPDTNAVGLWETLRVLFGGSAEHPLTENDLMEEIASLKLYDERAEALLLDSIDTDEVLAAEDEVGYSDDEVAEPGLEDPLASTEAAYSKEDLRDYLEAWADWIAEARELDIRLLNHPKGELMVASFILTGLPPTAVYKEAAEIIVEKGDLTPNGVISNLEALVRN